MTFDHQNIRERILKGAQAEIAYWRAFSAIPGWSRDLPRDQQGDIYRGVNNANKNTAKYEPSKWFPCLSVAERKRIQREIEAMERDGAIVRIRESGRTAYLKIITTDNTNKLTAGVTGKESL